MLKQETLPQSTLSPIFLLDFLGRAASHNFDATFAFLGLSAIFAFLFCEKWANFHHLLQRKPLRGKRLP